MSTNVHIKLLAVYDDGADINFWIKELNRIVGTFPPIFVPLGARIEGRFPFTVNRYERGRLDPVDADKLTLEVLKIRRPPEYESTSVLLSMCVWGTRDRKFPQWQLGPPGGWLTLGREGVAPMKGLKIRAMPVEYKPGSVVISIPTAKIGARALAPRLDD